MSGTRTRLDQAMDKRRLDLRKQWKDIASAAGVSTAALGAIRRGEYKPSSLTARGIEDALQWGHGSIEAILAGGEPTLLEDAGAPESGSSPEAGLAEQLAERLRWFEEDNERRQQETAERMKRLETEIERLRRQQSG